MHRGEPGYAHDTRAVNPSLMPKMSFDTLKDLVPVILIGTAPMVLVTPPSKAITAVGKGH